MSTTAPVALGALGKHILNTNMNASGLRSFLNGQHIKIVNAMPASLFLEGIMGLENLSGIAEKFYGHRGSDFAKCASGAPDSLKEKDDRISISVRAK